jgi:hypothetical protein
MPASSDATWASVTKGAKSGIGGAKITDEDRNQTALLKITRLHSNL